MRTRCYADAESTGSACLACDRRAECQNKPTVEHILHSHIHFFIEGASQNDQCLSLSTLFLAYYICGSAGSMLRNAAISPRRFCRFLSAENSPSASKRAISARLRLCSSRSDGVEGGRCGSCTVAGSSGGGGGGGSGGGGCHLVSRVVSW